MVNNSRTIFWSLACLALACSWATVARAAAANETAADEAPAAEDSTSAPEDSTTAAPAAANIKYDLKYKFTPGEVLRTEIVHRATVQTTIQGNSQTAETQSKSVKRWQVGKVEKNGNVSFVHSVENIDMWQKTQGRQEVRYNSATDTEIPPGYEEAASAVGVPLTNVTMDCRGKILKRQEKRAQPGNASTQMTMPLPDQPIALGETWNSPIDIDVVLQDGSTKKIKTRQVFTLTKVVDDLATISIDSQILTPVHDPAIEAQLIQRLSSGEVRFDIAKGRVLGQQLDLDRRVIGFSGAASSMHYVTRFTEQLLPEAPQTARRQPAKPAEAEKPGEQAETQPSE